MSTIVLSNIVLSNIVLSNIVSSNIVLKTVHGSRQERALAGKRPARAFRVAMALFLALPFVSARAPAQDPDLLLPDITVRRNDLFDNDIRTDISAGRVHLRMSNGTPNIGAGKLHLYGVLPDNGDGTQDVRQRVFRQDGSFVDLEAGQFIYHPGHNHIHIEAWCIYRLREMLPDDGVGDVVAEGNKTSFCILDLGVFNSGLPNFRPGGEFHSCSSTVQGLSVGWLDIYDKSLSGQNIEITGVEPGVYWLESEVDPEDNILESDETNNIARVPVTIGNTGAIPADAFEPNDTVIDLTKRSPGSPNSPNLGPVNPKRTIRDLTIHRRGNRDVFKFYSPAVGGSDDFVRVDYNSARTALELQLTDAETLLDTRTSAGEESPREISLEGLAPGWYFVQVVPLHNTLSESYTLTVNPPANAPPSIRVLDPAAGDVLSPHGLGVYNVRWLVDDPEDRETWVSVFLNTSPILDGNEILLPTSLFTPGELGFHVVNSADVEPGTYWAYCEATDGGATVGSWSLGTVTFFPVPESCTTIGGVGPDCDENGIIDSCDLEYGSALDCNSNGVPDVCDIAGGVLEDLDENGVPDNCGLPFHRGDSNDDGRLDVSDPVAVLNHLFLGGQTLPCREAADANNDARIDLTDGVYLLHYLFQSGSAPVRPGPPSMPCEPDIDPSGSPKNLGCDAYTSC